MDCGGCGDLCAVFLQGHPVQGLALCALCGHRGDGLLQVEGTNVNRPTESIDTLGCASV